MQANIPGSVVLRTTVSILSLSMLLGLVFAWVVSTGIERREQSAAEARLHELLTTVESTTEIACYLGDRKLAAEIGSGLLRTQIVSAVRVTSGASVLFAGGPAAPEPRRPDSSMSVTRIIHSPFEPGQAVGSIEIRPNQTMIAARVHTLSREWMLALALQAGLVAAGVAVAVYFFVTRPIREISTELHRARQQTGRMLKTPFGNESDEIGSLVVDINSLIGNLTTLLETERDLRIERELAARRTRLIFEKAASGIFVLDTHGMLQSWNPAFMRILGLLHGCTPEAGVTPLRDMIAIHADRIDQLIRTCIESGQPADVDLELDNGIWIEVSVNPSGPATLQGFVNDITERKRAELSARSQADHDPLTGLLNRRGMDTAVAELFALSAPAAPRPFAWLQIDLDRFKAVNDNYGHDAGDIVLRHVARVLQRSLRADDLVSRPGGDEFQAVLVNIKDRQTALDIANTLIAEISQHIALDAQREVQIGASIGIAFSNPSDRAALPVMRRADSALYAAKHSGRGRACFAPQPATIPTEGAAA